MTNYTTYIGQLKRGILKFSEKLSTGLSRPEMKFVCNMLYGLLKGQSVKLTNIVRALSESITLKKTVDRLSRNLTSFDSRGNLRKPCKNP